MRNFILFMGLFISSISFSQIEILLPPKNNGIGTVPNWSKEVTRETVDTCGAYYNNYIGLVKTSDVYYEGMRTGGIGDFDPYPGRAQHFHANQDIEVSGIQFYSFQTNPMVDSLMAITVLFDYDEVLDSIGIELARDTVWVSHTTFTPLLTELEVNSVFDEPVIVTEDYIVAVYTPTNDSLKIITSSASAGDGDGEGVSFAYYDNPVAPSYTGWYATLPYFGPSYDIDYLINPLVRFALHNDYVMSTDSICPDIVSAVCTEYVQVPNFSDLHYNAFAADPTGKVLWTWDDGLQNTSLTSLCHTYYETGNYTITLSDSMRRHDYFDLTCAVEILKTIVVMDSAVANATVSTTGLTAVFNGMPSLTDSVGWNFGDDSEGSTLEDPTHIYSEVGTYNVWFYAYGPCNTDSVLVLVTVDDVGINENELAVYIYPNPANEKISIKGLSGTSSVELISILGEVVLSQSGVKSELNIPISTIASGTYFIRIKTANLGNYKETTKKIIIRH